MEINLMCTSAGLQPLYDEDYDEKRKLKIGKIYRAKVVVPRNGAFTRKYFALLKCAWEYQNERVVEFFHNSFDCFRKTIEIASGWCDPVFDLNTNTWVEQAKSIAFDKMNDAEFAELYERTKDVLFQRFLKHVSMEEFEQVLMNF